MKTGQTESLWVWVTLSFNDPSGWAFTEGPDTMRRPELYRTKGAEKQWVKTEIRLT